MKSFYRHMNPAKAREIRRLYFDEGLKQREIAVRFRITQHSVSRIVNGYVWSEA